jgi:hypothetical protein
MKSLTNICIKAIAKRYPLFFQQLDLLPADLKEKIIQKHLNPTNNMQLFSGHWYPRISSPVDTDWGNYKL